MLLDKKCYLSKNKFIKILKNYFIYKKNNHIALLFIKLLG